MSASVFPTPPIVSELHLARIDFYSQIVVFWTWEVDKIAFLKGGVVDLWKLFWHFVSTTLRKNIWNDEAGEIQSFLTVDWRLSSCFLQFALSLCLFSRHFTFSMPISGDTFGCWSGCGSKLHSAVDRRQECYAWLWYAYGLSGWTTFPRLQVGYLLFFHFF